MTTCLVNIMFANHETIETKPCWSPKHERKAIFSKFLFRILQIRIQLLSPPDRFFRGKLSVRCYHPASVPRVAVAHPHPRLRFTFRFACLGLLRVCAAGTLFLVASSMCPQCTPPFRSRRQEGTESPNHSTQ